MSDTARAVLEYLDALGIEYRMAEHPPAFTMADCAAIDRQLGALTVKNIFLTTKNKKRCFLCVCCPDARFHTADISKQVGSSRLSFAPEAMLFERLRCHGGSASPLGLIFPEAREVILIVDSALREVQTLAFHPCDNTQTVAMAAADFFDRFLTAVGTEVVDVVFNEEWGMGNGG